MPPLEMGTTTYQWTKKVMGHSNELEPKSLSKTPSRSSKKQQVDFKKVERGEAMKQKRRHLSQTSKEVSKAI